jgi:hypothetical protein
MTQQKTSLFLHTLAVPIAEPSASTLALPSVNAAKATEQLLLQMLSMGRMPISLPPAKTVRDAQLGVSDETIAMDQHLYKPEDLSLHSQKHKLANAKEFQRAEEQQQQQSSKHGLDPQVRLLIAETVAQCEKRIIETLGFKNQSQGQQCAQSRDYGDFGAEEHIRCADEILLEKLEVRMKQLIDDAVGKCESRLLDRINELSVCDCQKSVTK